MRALPVHNRQKVASIEDNVGRVKLAVQQRKRQPPWLVPAHVEEGIVEHGERVEVDLGVVSKVILERASYVPIPRVRRDPGPPRVVEKTVVVQLFKIGRCLLYTSDAADE